MDLTKRVNAWLATIKHDTVVVSHGGVSRALRGSVVPVSRDEVPRLKVPQDRILMLRRGFMDWL